MAAFLLTILAVYTLMQPSAFDAYLLRQFFFFPECTVEQPLDCWLISRADKQATFLLHRLPNIAFVTFGTICLGLIIAGFRYQALRHLRLPLIVLLLSIITCPTIVAVLKKITMQYCPNQLPEFNGSLSEKARCYPAAHPAAGYSFLALAFAPLKRKWRIIGAIAGLSLGLALSWVQMARGEHSPSHILATIAIAMFVSYSLRCLIISRRLSLA